jgi:plasmid replication initiation protein
MKIDNKDVIQSYILTAARYDFSVYEKRIIYRLVELCQCAIEGQKLNHNFVINNLLFDELREIEMPISAFLKDDKDENHTQAKKALLDLNNKMINYEDGEVWKPIRIIEMPKLFKKGFVRFILQKEIYEAILNFSKGWRRFELKTAMEFDTVYAMRFYELLSGKREPIVYKIDALKVMFNVDKKYKLTADFMRYVVDKAKIELDKKSPFSFNYHTIKEFGSKKIVSIKFYPYEIAKNRDETIEHKKLNKQVSLRWSIDKIYLDYLKQNYHFTNQEIKNNIEVFKQAVETIDILGFLAKKKREAGNKKNPKGWIIGAIKKEITAKAEKKD